MDSEPQEQAYYWQRDQLRQICINTQSQKHSAQHHSLLQKTLISDALVDPAKALLIDEDVGLRLIRWACGTLWGTGRVLSGKCHFIVSHEKKDRNLSGLLTVHPGKQTT